MASWVTLVLWLVAVPNIVTGLWAVADPRHWYDTLPGWAPHLVAAHPPFNEHLALDAGAGLLAVGVIAASAEEAPSTITLLLSVAAGVAVLVGSNRGRAEGAAR
jgi:hypothetical protein